MCRKIGLMGKDVCWKWDRWGERGEIRTRHFHSSPKIGKEVFSLDGPMAASANLEFHAAAADPAGQRARSAGEFMCGCKSVNKILRIVQAGDGDTAGTVHHDRAARDTDAGTRCDEVIGFDGLGNGETCGSTAGISRLGRKVVFDVHAAEISLDAKDPMAALEVKTNLSAAVETTRTQGLIAGCSYRRNTAVGEIAGWTENGAGKRIAVAFDATGISADVKALKILRVGRANRKKRKNKHTGSRYESVQNTPHLSIEFSFTGGRTNLISWFSCALPLER
jgi:hypothetical protein